MSTTENTPFIPFNQRPAIEMANAVERELWEQARYTLADLTAAEIKMIADATDDMTAAEAVEAFFEGDLG